MAALWFFSCIRSLHCQHVGTSNVKDSASKKREKLSVRRSGGLGRKRAECNLGRRDMSPLNFTAVQFRNRTYLQLACSKGLQEQDEACTM